MSEAKYAISYYDLGSTISKIRKNIVQ